MTQFGARLELDVHRRADRGGLFWLAPDRASDALRLPRSGEFRIRTRPAGALVIVPERTPDAALGSFRLRRGDGLPLPVLSAKNDDPTIQSVDVQPQIRLGLRLGPIAEGPLDLEVLLGGSVVARVRVDVRAGVNTPVTIPVR